MKLQTQLAPTITQTDKVSRIEYGNGIIKVYFSKSLIVNGLSTAVGSLSAQLNIVSSVAATATNQAAGGGLDTTICTASSD